MATNVSRLRLTNGYSSLIAVIIASLPPNCFVFLKLKKNFIITRRIQRVHVKKNTLTELSKPNVSNIRKNIIAHIGPAGIVEIASG